MYRTARDLSLISVVICRSLSELHPGFRPQPRRKTNYCWSRRSLLSISKMNCDSGRGGGESSSCLLDCWSAGEGIERGTDLPADQAEDDIHKGYDKELGHIQKTEAQAREAKADFDQAIAQSAAAPTLLDAGSHP